ncbi:MAG: pyridoxal-phosphate dependent enzyme, partial [Myxococcales bacterium]
ALVLSLETDFDGCMKVVQELAKDDTIYLANSMNSLRIEGQKTLSIEVCQQLGWTVPDWVVIPGGNLGNVSALGRGFELMKALGLVDRLPRIAVAQAANAGPLYASFQKRFAGFESLKAQRTLASAIQIGDPVSYKKAIRALQACDGVVAAVSEDALANAAARADLTGTYADPHTGVALAATFELLQSGVIGRRDRVVVVSTAHGLKFTEFKVGYHEGTLEGVQSRHRNRPVEVAASFAEVRGVIEAFARRSGAI